MNRFGYLLLSVVLFICVACEPSDAGAVLQPEEDKMSVQTDSFHVKSTTELLQHRYSESDKVELGYVVDPIYGAFKMDFLSEFRYARDTFPATATDATLNLVLYYRSYYGDSLSANEVLVYALQKALDFEQDYTTDVLVSDYCDKSVLLGQKTYVPYDATIPDSLRQEEKYCDKVVVKLPQQYCNELLTNRTYTQSQDAFLELIKGVYVTNSYGSRAVLNVDSVNLELNYRYAPDVAKPDSLIDAVRIYPTNKETTAMVRVSEVQPPALLATDSIRYVVSSSGYALRVHLPLKALSEALHREDAEAKLNINHASLIIEQALMDDPVTSKMTPPAVLMLIREKDMDAFFTQSKYPADGIETVLGVYKEEQKRYQFNNMAGYLETLLSDSETDLEQVNDFFIVPVSGVTDVAGTNAVVRHLYKPFAVRLRSEKNQKSPMRLAVTYSVL
ncbi:MAG: DUF4270 family protein [Paludibacteraceae bacterium]|nr:DUF4270 family protein [Paludibacteraceae bacterium]